MVALYITSSEKGNGKTAVCAGLGKQLLSTGKKVGFFKPIITDRKNLQEKEADSDATFFKSLLGLYEPADAICPVFDNEGGLRSGLKAAYAKVSQGKDVVIMEGVSEQSQISDYVVETLSCKVIIVESYLQEPSKAAESYKGFGKQLLGVVLNKVPVSRVEQVRIKVTADYEKAGAKLLGVLPEDRALLALTVGELAERIQGEMLRGAEKSAELVENVMLGAMCVDPGPYYYNRKVNKAVVVRSERPDMQLAALETSTRCLVLTGEVAPKPVVVSQAEEKDVPIILVKDTAANVAGIIEDTFGKTGFCQENKLAKLAGIMEKHFDFPAVYKGLGLAS